MYFYCYCIDPLVTRALFALVESLVSVDMCFNILSAFQLQGSPLGVIQGMLAVCQRILKAAAAPKSTGLWSCPIAAPKADNYSK